MPIDRDLFCAVDRHDTSAVRRALENNANPNVCSTTGTHALHIAAWRGYPDIVTLLIEAGADPDVREQTTGKTPLHFARGVQVIDSLIEAGADVNARTKDENDVPLHNPFLALASMARLISANADLNAKNVLGWTPLHIFASYSNIEAVSLLLRHEADSNVLNSQGETPLDIARWVEDKEIAALIESHVLKTCAMTKQIRHNKGGLGL